MTTMLADRALIRLSGEDVRGFLQGLVTNDTAELTPERPRWAGLLSAQGKALFDFILWADGEDVLVDCEENQADALAKRLRSTACAVRSASSVRSNLPCIGPRWATRRADPAPARSLAGAGCAPARPAAGGWSTGCGSVSRRAPRSWGRTRSCG
jgi:folate-binding Fe-S cluster repair protein YgfZ